MSRRRRRHRRGYKHHRNSFAANNRRFRHRKRAGWGLNLYRSTRDAKVAGVAAGLADHWDMEHWVMRLTWVALFLFTGTLAFWLYVACWLLMARRPSRKTADSNFESDKEYEYEEAEVEMEYDERHHDYRPRKVFRYSESGSVRLKRARERLDAALGRVEDMESYVTSRQYNLNQEFSKL
ncbi:MAG: phage shock protein C [Halioglobus sp.]|jgi:phage shock protein C